MRNQKSNKPLVSIIMPVYNAGDFLLSSIESILSQTYSNFEFVIVDDASTDHSWKIIKEFAKKDKRIKAFRNKKNLGVSATANFAISKTKGKFLARMDADDVSLRDRIERQIKFLEKNPDYIAIGGQCLLINQKGERIGEKIFPCKHQEIYKMSYQAMPMQQPTLMVNTRLLPKNFVWYEKELTTAEEVDFIFRLFKYGQCANLEDFVLKYRIHPKNISLINPKKTFFNTYQARKNAVSKHGYQPTLSARLINYCQWLAISLLPNPVIYPLFALWRGLMPIRNLLPVLPKVNLSLPKFAFSK